MKHTLKKLGLTFAGGCLGGITATALNIALGLINFPSSVGVSYSQEANVGNLYAGILIGGIWGFIFLIPVLNNMWYLKGIILSLIPTLVQLMVVLPLEGGAKFFNIDVQSLTPVYILSLNIVWGMITAGFLEYTKGDETFG